MLNKERPEVIEAMKRFLVSNTYWDAEFKRDTGYNGNFFDGEELEQWFDSEYVEPFKLMRIQKNILESFDPTFWIARNFENDLELFMTKPEISDQANYWKEEGIYLIDVYNQLFPFIHKMETYQVGYILNNCEVVE